MTLVELCTAMAIVGLTATLALRMVYVADRAITREAGDAAAASSGLALAASLRDDVQAATAVKPRGAAGLDLTVPGIGLVRYVAGPQGVRRLQGTQARAFPGLAASFQGSTPFLVQARISDARGLKLRFAICPRNAPRPPERRSGMGGMGGGPKSGGGDK